MVFGTVMSHKRNESIEQILEKLKIKPKGREQATYVLQLIHLAHFTFLQCSGENMSFRMVLQLFNWDRQIPTSCNGTDYAIISVDIDMPQPQPATKPHTATCSPPSMTWGKELER